MGVQRIRTMGSCFSQNLFLAYFFHQETSTEILDIFLSILVALNLKSIASIKSLIIESLVLGQRDGSAGKGTAAKPFDLNLIPRIHTMEEEN